MSKLANVIFYILSLGAMGGGLWGALLAIDKLLDLFQF